MKSGNSMVVVAILAAGVLAVLPVGTRESLTSWVSGALAQGTESVTSEPGSPSAARGRALLAKVDVVGERPDVAGYQRDRFGYAWKDVDRNGCDTRNDVLAEQMTQVSFRPGTNQCVVVAGTLDDPCTGRTISFTKAKASAVQVDHVYSLSQAWDMGAHRWSQQRREAFANDTKVNLLAVDGPANMAKGDKGPAQWSPADKRYACSYAVKYLLVATTCDLPVTRAEHRSLSTTVDGACR